MQASLSNKLPFHLFSHHRDSLKSSTYRNHITTSPLSQEKMTVTMESNGTQAIAIEDPNLRHLPKIADKIRHREAEGRPFFSVEYFPPKTEQGVSNLYHRAERMTAAEPLFCDVTWGAGGSTSALTLELSGNIQQYLGVDVMMHLTCTNMPAGKVLEGLEGAKSSGLRNILALRGDPPAGKEWTKCEDGFEHGTDLVRFIRANYGDYFGICVAGYPEGHPAGFLDGKLSMDQEMEYLKEKVDAGADFIITQMFYDVDCFLKFVQRCRQDGINIPILPGILPIQNYTGFKRMTGFCRTKVPQAILDAMEPIKDDDVAVKQFGIRLGVDMCRRILKSGMSPGIHFYTLNLEKSVMGIIDQLDLIPQTESIRSLPWRPATVDKRRQENVRPIFWANRPKSYLDRTSTWDDYPNGRWGDNRSPAYGNLGEYHLLGGAGWASAKQRDEAAARYGELKSFDDVVEVFVRFQKHELNRLPWSETEELATETSVISAPLTWLNKNEFLTINSQPRVNAAPSSDVTVGWGSPGGYVYQKAYVEFFAKAEKVDALFEIVKEYPSLTIYAATNGSDELKTNAKSKTTCAVTWGVFPNQEIIQPTIVDPQSFKVWKNEAFAVWEEVWADLYSQESASRAVLKDLRETLYLVNVVDNDYVGGDIFSIFKRVIRGNKGMVAKN